MQAKLGRVLEQVLNCAPGANAMTKDIILNVGRKTMVEVLDDAAQKFAVAVHGAEAPEGVAAFLEKRRPRWAEPT